MLVFLSGAPLLLLLAGDHFPKDVAARPTPPPKQRDATAGPSDQQSAAIVGFEALLKDAENELGRLPPSQPRPEWCLLIGNEPEDPELAQDPAPEVVRALAIRGLAVRPMSECGKVPPGTSRERAAAGIDRLSAQGGAVEFDAWFRIPSHNLGHRYRIVVKKVRGSWEAALAGGVW